MPSTCGAGPGWWSSRANSAAASLLGQRIAVLGAAFKPESDDVRDSPALSAAAQLQLQGAVVTVTDPQALANAAEALPGAASSNRI